MDDAKYCRRKMKEYQMKTESASHFKLKARITKNEIAYWLHQAVDHYSKGAKCNGTKKKKH